MSSPEGILNFARFPLHVEQPLRYQHCQKSVIGVFQYSRINQFLLSNSYNPDSPKNSRTLPVVLVLKTWYPENKLP